MIRNLTAQQLISTIKTVFAPGPDERALTIFTDLPGGKLPDNAAWMDRRRIATDWYTTLVQNFDALPFKAMNCCAYPNVGTNNGDLPRIVLLIDSDSGHHVPPSEGEVPLRRILEESSVVLAMTELSATAPLKNLARELGFRGATLPGFSRAMIPALGLDYVKINARVTALKERMDRARSALLTLSTGGKDYQLDLDLRFASGHISGGIIRTPGTVANLPSGEAYIVPFEGDGEKNLSRTNGFLPVQFGNEVVLYRIERNRAVEAKGDGAAAVTEAKKLRDEPAYGNIAELGIGVLSDWGVQPVGNTLLDEKLGLHVAFGRSDHFGGKTGPKSFRDSRNVIHIDWVYVPTCQPLIHVKSLMFTYESGGTDPILEDGVLLA
jgi:hypothetical protein